MDNKIQEIKDKYGNSAESIIANGLGMYKKGKMYQCPNGYAHKNGDRTPSMSWDSSANQFYCFGCGMKIDLYGYYREHMNYTHEEVLTDLLGIEKYEKSQIKRKIENFQSESEKLTDINKECIEYIKTRGIEEKTIQYFGLKSYLKAIAFPYFKYNSLIGVKTREPLKDPGKPKMRSVTGSKPFLFNCQNLDLGNPELIVCEGEFDCMILHQCGFTNCVSIGAGANSCKTIISQAEKLLENFNTVIVASDNDPAGTEMDIKMTELLPDKVKLIDKKLYTRNDINEEYFLKGKEGIIDLIESARFKVEGRRDLEKTPYKGLAKGKGKYVPTGLKDIDFALNDLAPRCVTLVAGRSNGGKTTLIKQIIANAIDKDNKVYLMNGENDAEMLINEIYQIVTGRDEKYYDKIKINKKTRKEPKPDVLKKLQRWHNKKLYMFNKGESKLKTISQLLEMIENEIKYNKYDLVVIDNMMSILSVKAAEKNEQQADFVQSLCDLSKNYNTHIILVLHVNKTYIKGAEMDFEQISGSSDIYNKADNIIAAMREYDPDKIAEGINGYINVLKNRYYGELPTIETFYDPETGLLLQREPSGNVMAYNFNWQAPTIHERGVDIF